MLGLTGREYFILFCQNMWSLDTEDALSEYETEIDDLLAAAEAAKDEGELTAWRQLVRQRNKIINKRYPRQSA